jgi:SAM-dependent methyltransferase
MFYKNLGNTDLCAQVDGYLSGSSAQSCMYCGWVGFTLSAAVDSEYYNSLQAAIPKYYPNGRAEFGVVRRKIEQLGLSDISVTDIGCGSFSFLETLPRRLDRRGIDFHVNQPADRSIMFESQDLSKSFEFSSDIATCFHVLEHMSEPLSFVQSIHDGLSRAGVCYISVPNPDSYRNRFHWDVLNLPPHHLNHYRPDSLVALLRKAGFFNVCYELCDRVTSLRIAARLYGQPRKQRAKTAEATSDKPSVFCRGKFNFESILVIGTKS